MPTPSTLPPERRPFPEGGNLAFVHIGKTAGTWLREQLSANFADDEVCPYRFHGQFSDPASVRQRYRFFSAHIGYDLADQIALSKIVVLRDPTERIVSLYNYWREVVDERPRSGPALAKRHTLAEMAALPEPSVIADFRNAQVWQLAASHDTATRRRVMARYGSSAKLLEQAIEHVNRVAVVGVVEHMPLLAAELRSKLDLKIDATAKPINVTVKRTGKDLLDDETLEALAPITALDRRLYRHVMANRILPHLADVPER